jgi:wyosine [tRNA(Phe)-imidazoG37] synthetase (radical SAM superfamily)
MHAHTHTQTHIHTHTQKHAHLHIHKYVQHTQTLTHAKVEQAYARTIMFPAASKYLSAASESNLHFQINIVIHGVGTHSSAHCCENAAIVVNIRINGYIVMRLQRKCVAACEVDVVTV